MELASVASAESASTLGPVDVVEALAAFGGAATWHQLRDLGVTRHALWRAVLCGAAIHPRRGVYILPAADAGTAAAARLGGVLSCTSAARALGLPVLGDARVHVTVPRTWGHATLSGVVVHRRDLDPAEHDDNRTSLLRTVVDCGREQPVRAAVAIGDAALRSGLDGAELTGAVRAARGPGSRALRFAAGLMDPSAESPIESCLRLLLQPLAPVVPQVHLPGVGRVDFVLAGWLVVEADGFEHHSTRSHYREDRRRSNALLAGGWSLLRFTYEDVVHRPDYVVGTVRSVLARQAA